MIAALPMYDWPEIRSATDAWWTGLARHLRAAGIKDVPDSLCREIGPPAIWEHPDLLLAQTCGLPLVRRYRDRLQVVATPCYAAEGCDGPTYRSAILVRADSPIDRPQAADGAAVAFNAPDSLSGHLALRLACGGVRFRAAIETGSHAASMATVQAGRADLCAIDCVTWAIARRHRPALTDGLRVIAWSPPMPALPYVTRHKLPVEPMLRALRCALADGALTAARLVLGIGDFSDVGRDYEIVAQADRTAPPLSLVSSE